MKVSLPVRSPAGPGLEIVNNDPHCDKQRLPRFSSPMSFLGLRAFAMALVMLGMFATSRGAMAINTTCVCDYDPTKDYFPTKLSAQYASNFQIEYFKSYKKITVQGSSGPVVTYAYLCGTPRPSEATTENAVQIPIDTVALTSSTFLPLVNYIGKLSTLLWVAVDAEDMPACLGKLHAEDKLASGTSLTAAAPQIVELSLERSKEQPDLVFCDNWDFASVNSTVSKHFGKHTQVFRLPQSSEKTPLGALEWLEVVAALYNTESKAAYVVSSIEERYNCIKNLVAQNPPENKVKVVWGNYYGNGGPYSGFYLGQCPNFYCDLVRDAGGEFLAAPSSLLNEEDALALVQQADVWIYPDGNVYFPTDTNQVFMTAARNLTFGETPVFQNERIFDFLGGHSLDWFDQRLAEPDVLLMDLVQAFYGTQYISASRKKAFLRNVHSEPVASQAPRDPNTCADTDGPLYTGWLAGPCAVAGTDGTENPELDLCPTSQQPEQPTGTGAASPLAVTGAGIALVLYAAVMLTTV